MVYKKTTVIQVSDSWFQAKLWFHIRVFVAPVVLHLQETNLPHVLKKITHWLNMYTTGKSSALCGKKEHCFTYLYNQCSLSDVNSSEMWKLLDLKVNRLITLFSWYIFQYKFRIKINISSVFCIVVHIRLSPRSDVCMVHPIQDILQFMSWFWQWMSYSSKNKDFCHSARLRYIIYCCK